MKTEQNVFYMYSCVDLREKVTHIKMAFNLMTKISIIVI